MDHCAPIASPKGNSCVPYETLLLIAQLYNSKYDDKITIPKRKSHAALWKSLQKKLASTCNAQSGESCWIEMPFIRDSGKYDEVSKYYRPKKPISWYKEKRKWLDTYDIQNVMQQYQEADKSFKFVGVFPSDFATRLQFPGVDRCVMQEMCDINLSELWKQKKKSLAVVLNTDDSHGNGEHWVAVFVGLEPRRKNYGVFFYDSVANQPQKEFTDFMNEMRGQLIALHPKRVDKLEVRWNKIQRQRKNFDCGVFSMLFHINMLKLGFDDVCKKMGDDDQVAKYRDILYRPSKFKKT